MKNATKRTDNVQYETVTNFTVGITLALASSLFIGTSFILKKKGLLTLTKSHDAIRAGSGGYGYLREFQWWAGLATMGLGELCNFTAYGFAPASVVTPLGALSVLVSALLAARFLGEKLNFLGKIGCLLTIAGSVILVIHAPKDSDINSLYEFYQKIITSEFRLFSVFTCFSVFLLIIHYGPRFGSKQVHIYLLICSLLGSFTVTGCKGLGVGLNELFHRRFTYSPWLTFFCAIVILICILIQMIYLNRALDLFSTPIVTTLYYVLFTTCVLITSGILFQEWKKLTFVNIFACLVGFLIITCGLILINYMKTNFQSNNQIKFPYLSSNSTNADLIVNDDNLSLMKNSQNEIN